MRRTWIKSPQWLLEDEKLIALALGSDTCAEHEWGIAPIEKAFGLAPDRDGIERRIIHRVPSGLQLLEGTDHTAIYFGLETLDSTRLKSHSELKPYCSNQTFITAWSESDFAVIGWGENNSPDRANILELWHAFQKQNIAIWASVQLLHSGPGLVLAIVSEIPEKLKTVMLNADIDAKKLSKSGEETGIEEQLKKAKKNWFSLKPKWTAFFKEPDYNKKTKHPVIFWLNPHEQDKYNSGYFTVEELQAWIENSGPIIKTRERKTNV